MTSPAVRASRPSSLIDPRHQGEYPIILGDSLKGDAKSEDLFLNIRYNWQPRAGFIDGRESKMRKSGDKWHFDIPNRGPGTYQYVTKGPSNQSEISDDKMTSFALIFDESKSAFVLEAINATLDMNLQVGPGMSRENAAVLPQLSNDLNSSKADPQANGHTTTTSDEDAADAANPYDFRHFLAEARESMEKSAQMAGNRTPNPGGRTPMSGTSTPIPGGNRFLATTPQFRPSQAKTESKSTEQRKKKTEAASRNVKATTKAPAKRETPRSVQPLSKATITDSDDSDDETITVSTVPVSKPVASRSSKPLGGKGHARNISNISNISENIGSSPHIIINDDDGDLQIDMGSPPPENRSRQRGRVDPGAFRSHTGTPVGGLSSNFGSTSRPISRTPLVGDRDRGRGRERDGDVRMRDIEAASEEDEDDDIEEFELGSPNLKSNAPRRGHVSRNDDSDEDGEYRSRRPHQLQVEQAPPTPLAPVASYEEDEEDFLAAALEAALEEENGNQNTGVGLGIGMADGNTQDDESEVSEEE